MRSLFQSSEEKEKKSVQKRHSELVDLKTIDYSLR